ncbi:potassium-transporting ATPase subunit beta [Boleophthalmus pectinirostris]|uniref:potassium-transporting ATPase subunit beta n=1 Tax=Boleophthalmus pectinirostris TaxID=150288 RepID=UPI000A1C41C1|nr:potassium-transporting ATPase subunit beta [Boleophthalmus pectinirostris]
MATLKEKRTCGQRCEDFGHFVWNSDNGTFMGRTPVKWVYISLYYVAFYIVMTALFSLAIYVLMYTLSPYAPDYQDRLKSPGVMVWPDTYGEEIVEISYNSSDKKSWKKMATILRHFLEPYNDTTQLIVNNVTCTKGKYFIQSHFTGHNHTKCSCPFTQSMLGPCSGLEDPTFGYNSSMPCVIIKMNRIINFLPSNITGVAPYVNCTILDGEENVENIEYFPKNGTMDLSYFPYYGRLAQPNYVNPLVAVRFNLVKEKEAKIECRVVSDVISYQNIHDPYEGKVVFDLSAES